jgi:hypothetical protein
VCLLKQMIKVEDKCSNSKFISTEALKRTHLKTG